MGKEDKKITVRDKNLIEKIGESIYYSSDVEQIKQQVKSDILGGICDALVNVLTAYLKPNSRRVGNSLDERGRYYQYHRAREHPGVAPRSEVAKTYASRSYVKRVVFETYLDADEILTELEQIITHSNSASVLDYYDLIGERHTHADANYGWTDLSEAKIRGNNKDGWMIIFPKTEVIR